MLLWLFLQSLMLFLFVISTFSLKRSASQPFIKRDLQKVEVYDLQCFLLACMIQKAVLAALLGPYD